jgi:hypothetical protein
MLLGLTDGSGLRRPATAAEEGLPSDKQNTLDASPISDSPLVIELYTSQGCSSCPPADEYMAELAKRPDILALTLPVDYWDYLGWKDTLANPMNVRRQRSYAHRLGNPRVYTPQMIIHGATEAVGSNRSAVEKAMQAARKLRPPQIRIHLRLTKDRLNIYVPSLKGISPEPRAIWIAYFDDTVEVAIKRGENGGRKITYSNVLRENTSIGVWAGEGVRLSLPYAEIMARGYDNCAIIVQDMHAGLIYGAATLRLQGDPIAGKRDPLAGPY